MILFGINKNSFISGVSVKCEQKVQEVLQEYVDEALSKQKCENNKNNNVVPKAILKLIPVVTTEHGEDVPGRLSKRQDHSNLDDIKVWRPVSHPPRCMIEVYVSYVSHMSHMSHNSDSSYLFSCVDKNDQHEDLETYSAWKVVDASNSKIKKMDISDIVNHLS